MPPPVLPFVLRDIADGLDYTVILTYVSPLIRPLALSIKRGQ